MNRFSALVRNASRHPLVARLDRAMRKGAAKSSRGIHGTAQMLLGSGFDVDVNVAYKHLALQLNHGQRRDADTRSVMLVSPEGGDLFAQSSTMLARNFANVRRAPVLLVDLERRGTMTDTIERRDEPPGLMQLLQQENPSLDEFVQQTSDPDVFLLPVGQAPAGRGARVDELRNTRQFLWAAKARFDFVIIHGGSLLHDSFALAIAPHVGKVLVCSIENQTRLSDLDAALKNLELSRVKNIGHVMVRRRGTR